MPHFLQASKGQGECSSYLAGWCSPALGCPGEALGQHAAAGQQHEGVPEAEERTIHWKDYITFPRI